MGWQVIYHYGNDEAMARRCFDGKQLPTDEASTFEAVDAQGVVVGYSERPGAEDVQAQDWRMAYDYGDGELAEWATWLTFDGKARPFDRADFLYLVDPAGTVVGTFDVLKEAMRYAEH